LSGCQRRISSLQEAKPRVTVTSTHSGINKEIQISVSRNGFGYGLCPGTAETYFKVKFKERKEERKKERKKVRKKEIKKLR
jgi:hypothetical protein